MSLYISRICLNPLFAPALRLAADPYALHAKLLATLPCRPRDKPKTGAQPKTAELLFRVDTTDSGPNVLVQSSAQPDWSSLELAPRALRCDPETREYAPTLAFGQSLSFRLLCRPSQRKAVKPRNLESKSGPRTDCRTDEDRFAWLRRKGEEHGFIVETVGLTLISFAAIKSVIPPRDKGGSFTAVQFDGVLVVTDPDKLREAVRNGIGPQKAFGFGLLSLAALRE